ncbi:MAG: RNA polymerase sigma factor [Candidatus Cyclobacteriaceae bacterium M2_1C_046]
MSKLTIHTTLSIDNNFLAEGEAEEINDKIMKLITLLPKKCQHSFYMATIHGMSDQEVGQFLNCSAEKIREHMSDAIRYIRENVEFIRSEIS